MKVFISIFLLWIASPSMAQNSKKDKFRPMATHFIGGSFQQFDGLNGRIAGFPQFKKLKGYTPTLGLGWQKELNRVISGGGITIGSSMSGHSDEKSSTIRYIGLNADIGYDVLDNEKITLYPLAGLGIQKYQAIFHKDNTTVAFDDVLESPAVQNSIHSVKFYNSFVLYRLGLGFSLRSPKNPSHSIGIQAGYSGSFKKNDWKSSEKRVLGNAPEDKISQFFISIILSNKPMFMKCCNK